MNRAPPVPSYTYAPTASVHQPYSAHQPPTPQSPATARSVSFHQPGHYAQNPVMFARLQNVVFAAHPQTSRVGQLQSTPLAYPPTTNGDSTIVRTVVPSYTGIVGDNRPLLATQYAVSGDVRQIVSRNVDIMKPTARVNPIDRYCEQTTPSSANGTITNPPSHVHYKTNEYTTKQTGTTQEQPYVPNKESSQSSMPAITRIIDNRKPEPGLVGLMNIGNTCYMNSTVQCLLNIPLLKDYFLTHYNILDVNVNSPSRGEIARALRDIFTYVWRGHLKDPISPLMLKSSISRVAPRFSGFGQHDAHEFLRFLLDELHADLNRVRTKPPYIERKDDDHLSDNTKADLYWSDHLRFNDSIINDLFCGQLKSTTVCQSCRFASSCFDPFMDLSLPIPGESSKFKYGLNSLRTPRDFRLSDCFAEFMKAESLDGNDQLYCSKCKKHRNFTKQMSIWKLPQVLVIQLKRFSNEDGNFRKISTPVLLPMRAIDFSSTVDKSSPHRNNFVYNLAGVSIHVGSLLGGHYVSNCLNSETDQWHQFDDDDIHRLGSDDRSFSMSYILFYTRAT